MKTVFSYALPYKWPVIIALILMIIEMFVELAQPLIIGKIVDEGILQSDATAIWQWGLLMFGLSVLALVTGIINSYFSAHAAQSFSYDLRNALFKKIQSFSMATYLRYPTAGLITRLTSDVTQVQTMFFMSLRIMFRAPLLVIGSVIMAFYVNAEIAMYLVIGVPLLFIFLWVMVGKGIRYFSQVQKKLDRVNRLLQEALQAIRLVKAYMRGSYEASRFQKVASNLQIDTTKALRNMEIIMPILLLVMNISLLAVLWFGAEQVRAGDAPVGDIVSIVNYAMRMTSSFSILTFIIIAFARAKASSDRMAEILLEDEGIEHSEGTRKVDMNQLGTLSFRNVTFYYPDSDRMVLSDVSFDVAAGEKLAIMGATGAGKSTLLQLIPRFYDVSAGEVVVNGRNVQSWELATLREMIGFVPQQSMLFTGSILKNVSWGKAEALLDEVQHATAQAQIHEAVENFPNAYETRVGQKGVNLSGGQKQRLSIARALIRKSHILILDDSTSALDVKTENRLWEALAEEQSTMLVVTQKVRTAKGADRILLLEEGQIVGLGTHDELLATNLLYQKIARSQQEVE